MYAYILRRFLILKPTLIIISMLTFLVIELPPGDFLTSMMDELEEEYGAAADRQIDLLRKRYGLDQPIYMRYFMWIKNIITRGDFGISFAENRPVSEIIWERLPMTFLVVFCSLVFQFSFSIIIGLYSAAKQHTFFDYFFTLSAFIGMSIPNFLLALVIMIFLYYNFGISLGGLMSAKYVGEPFNLAKIIDVARHLIAPVIVIGTAGTAGQVRVLRGVMLDELGKQYVQTARAKGLKENYLLWKHPLKVAILPLVSTIGWWMPRLFSGEIIVSVVLSLPTIGPVMLRSLLSQDMYVAGSIVLVSSILTLLGTLVSDILLAALDPRIRYD